MVLKSCVSKEILDEVHNLGDDYNAITKRLDSKYGNTEKLVDASIFRQIVKAEMKALSR